MPPFTPLSLLRIGTSCVAMLLSVTLAAFAQVGQQAPPGPLSKAHSALEGAGACQSCHGADRKVASDLCLSCHQPIADRMRLKKGVHRAVTGDCSGCHVEHGGVDADLRPLDPADFDHAGETGFALKGRHATVAKNCASCHTSRSYLTVSPSCATCHTDAHAARRGKACETCHTPEGWASASRAFHKTGRFNLEGRHLDVPCESCHLKGAVKGTPTKCVDCHWIRRQDDPYRTRLGSDCETCHRPVSWTAVTWNHGAATGTPLSPAHRALACDNCHTNRRFDAGSPSCYSCHAKQYQSSTQPSHAAAGFPTQCELCHKPSHTSFTQATFQHNAYFPLSGVHATQACASCHATASTRARRATATAATARTTSARASPNHAAAGFPTACESCHRPSDPSWKTTLQSQRRLSARGRARDAAVRGLSQEQRLQGHAARLRRVPPDELRAHDEPESRGRRVPDRVRVVSPADRRELDGRRSTTAASSRSSGVTRRSLLGVSQEQRLQGHAARLCRLPPRRTTIARPIPNHASSGFPTACESCHRALGCELARHVQSQRRVHARRRARDAGLHGVPQEQRLQGHAARLLRLSPDRLRAHRQPEPRRGRLPDGVRLLSQRFVARPGRRVSTTTGSSCWPGATCRRRAVRATGTASTGVRRASVIPAIRRSTTARRTPITGRRGSRRPARRATGTPTRRSTRAGSTTRGSRSRPGGTPAGPAPSAISIPTTTRCSAARRATPARKWTPSTRAARATGTTPPPATRATRQGRARRNP